MGFRFQKRIKLGKRFGFNISKSSITPSYKNKRGSLSSKGYSLRTGIPGLSYRKTYKKAKGSGCFGTLVVMSLITIASCKKTIEDTQIVKIESSINKKDTISIKIKTKDYKIENKPTEKPSNEEIDNAVKEFEVLYNELNLFKRKADFKKYGFAISGPYNAWLKKVKRLKSRSHILIHKGIIVSELENLGISYVRSKGLETQITKYFNKVFSEAIESN